jgi:hypothetical protein
MPHLGLRGRLYLLKRVGIIVENGLFLHKTFLTAPIVTIVQNSCPPPHITIPAQFTKSKDDRHDDIIDRLNYE